MATGDRKDPYRQFRFRVEIDGISQAGFSECNFADTTTDPVEYREGNETTTFRNHAQLKIPFCRETTAPFGSRIPDTASLCLHIKLWAPAFLW